MQPFVGLAILRVDFIILLGKKPSEQEFLLHMIPITNKSLERMQPFAAEHLSQCDADSWDESAFQQTFLISD